LRSCRFLLSCKKYHLAIPEVKARYTSRMTLCTGGAHPDHGTRCGRIRAGMQRPGSGLNREGCARSIGPRGLMPKGDEIVELDLVIAALQTFAVLFLVCGVYLATHRTGGSQISAEPASPAPARSLWRERTALPDDIRRTGGRKISNPG
jgi:hypothetical protein